MVQPLVSPPLSHPFVMGSDTNGATQYKTTTQYITYPCLIVEVLSPSKEAYDRGNKFKMYRRNPSLQEYVLVSVDTIKIELFRKTETDDWRIINYQTGDTVELKSVDLICQIEQVYSSPKSFANNFQVKLLLVNGFPRLRRGKPFRIAI